MAGKNNKIWVWKLVAEVNYEMEEICELVLIPTGEKGVQERNLTKMIVHIYNSRGCNHHFFPLVFDILGRVLYGLQSN